MQKIKWFPFSHMNYASATLNIWVWSNDFCKNYSSEENCFTLKKKMLSIEVMIFL